MDIQGGSQAYGTQPGVDPGSVADASNAGKAQAIADSLASSDMAPINQPGAVGSTKKPITSPANLPAIPPPDGQAVTVSDQKLKQLQIKYQKATAEQRTKILAGLPPKVQFLVEHGKGNDADVAKGAVDGTAKLAALADVAPVVPVPPPPELDPSNMVKIPKAGPVNPVAPTQEKQAQQLSNLLTSTTNATRITRAGVASVSGDPSIASFMAAVSKAINGLKEFLNKIATSGNAATKFVKEGVNKAQDNKQLRDKQIRDAKKAAEAKAKSMMGGFLGFLMAIFAPFLMLMMPLFLMLKATGVGNLLQHLPLMGPLLKNLVNTMGNPQNLLPGSMYLMQIKAMQGQYNNLDDPNAKTTSFGDDMKASFGSFTKTLMTITIGGLMKWMEVFQEGLNLLAHNYQKPQSNTPGADGNTDWHSLQASDGDDKDTSKAGSSSGATQAGHTATGAAILSAYPAESREVMGPEEAAALVIALNSGGSIQDHALAPSASQGQELQQGQKVVSEAFLEKAKAQNPSLSLGNFTVVKNVGVFTSQNGQIVQVAYAKGLEPQRAVDPQAFQQLLATHNSSHPDPRDPSTVKVDGVGTFKVDGNHIQQTVYDKQFIPEENPGLYKQPVGAIGVGGMERALPVLLTLLDAKSNDLMQSANALFGGFPALAGMVNTPNSNMGGDVLGLNGGGSDTGYALSAGVQAQSSGNNVPILSDVTGGPSVANSAQGVGNALPASIAQGQIARNMAKWAADSDENTADMVAQIMQMITLLEKLQAAVATGQMSPSDIPTGQLVGIMNAMKADGFGSTPSTADAARSFDEAQAKGQTGDAFGMIDDLSAALSKLGVDPLQFGGANQAKVDDLSQESVPTSGDLGNYISGQAAA